MIEELVCDRVLGNVLIELAKEASEKGRRDLAYILSSCACGFYQQCEHSEGIRICKKYMLDPNFGTAAGFEVQIRLAPLRQKLIPVISALVQSEEEMHEILKETMVRILSDE